MGFLLRVLASGAVFILTRVSQEPLQAGEQPVLLLRNQVCYSLAW
jgi:hypothetical protein